MHGRGVCMVGGHVWQAGHAWQGGMHGRGACMVGGMHGRGVCMAGGAWQGGMHGKGGMCSGGGHCGRGACMVGGMHGMHTAPQQILQDTVNERVVHILLECILVFTFIFHNKLKTSKMNLFYLRFIYVWLLTT